MFKYSVIILPTIAIIIGGIYYYSTYDGNLWHIMSGVDTATSIPLAILAFFGTMEYFRHDDEIKILFQTEKGNYRIDGHVLRKNCTRSEVLGILGMYRTNVKKQIYFTIEQNKKNLKAIQEIQNGKDKELMLEINFEELENLEYKDVNNSK